jgi:hypothetical protein
MPLSWNEIKSRALAFSKHWADAGNEDAEAKLCLIAFFEICVKPKRARRQGCT